MYVCDKYFTKILNTPKNIPDKGDIIFVYNDSEITHLVDNNYIQITNAETQQDEGIQFSDVVENKEAVSSAAEIEFENL